MAAAERGATGGEVTLYGAMVGRGQKAGAETLWRLQPRLMSTLQRSPVEEEGWDSREAVHQIWTAPP